MDEYNIYNRFYKKNSTVFFELLKNNKVETVLDIRLNNNSQLAGFSKYPDIEFFLNEICNIKVLVNKYVGLISLQYYQTIIAYIIDTMPIATVSNIAQ